MTDVTSEHELRASKIKNPVIGRKPDGLFSLAREGRPPITVAIEVETTHRNRKRIEGVVSKYVDTYEKDPSGLRGVLIVTTTREMARTYREVTSQLGQKYPKRFILSESLDLSDVKETILGRTFIPMSENRTGPLMKWASTCPSKPLKIERTDFPRNTGYTYRKTDQAPTNGVKQ